MGPHVPQDSGFMHNVYRPAGLSTSGVTSGAGLHTERHL